MKLKIGILCAVAFTLCSCTRTVYTPVETARTEREEVTRWRTDTVVDRDTVSVLRRGDTILLESTKWRWRIREVHDTTLMERIDSVAVPYPVERELSRWERTKMDFGGIAIGSLAAVLCAAVAWLARRFRK